VIDKAEDERKQICLAIGQRLRQSRKERGFTLDVLAEKTGFSKSYLSQIENLKREPSIGTLTKIARALSIEALFLISGIHPEAGQPDFTLVRADERKSMPEPFGKTGLRYESVAYRKKDRLMDAYIVEMGFDFPKGTKPWEGQEFVFVLEGTHEFVYDGKSHILNQGDSYYFDTNRAHMGRSIGRAPSKVLAVFTSRRE
jgi:transcriptional regulator with XRE-family HTH domain